MAESFNSGKNPAAYDDDMVKQALKAGLEHLEASDELKRKTLDRCSAELDRNSRPKTFLSYILNKTALRYCATVAAACLILVVIVKFPMLFGNKSATQNNAAMDRTQAAADAGGAAGSAPGSAAPALSKSANNYTLTAPSTESSSSPEPAPSVEPAPALAPAITMEGGQNNDVSIMFSESLSVNALNSLNNNAGEQTRGNSAKSVEAFNAVVSNYNQSNGTKLACDENRILTVSTVSKDGITSEMLRKTDDYHQIIGTYSYWILPLKNDQGEIITLLPVLETNSANVSENKSDINITYGGENWATSQTFAINADKNTIDLMLDRNTLEKLVQGIAGISNITEVLIVDINNGKDFVALITADGKEFAVPLFTTIKTSLLSNGQLYPIREALDSLAAYLDTDSLNK